MMPTLEEEICRSCGCEMIPIVSEGIPPHAWQATCAICQRWLRWLPKTPKMPPTTHRPPSAKQLAYLLILGDTDEPPCTMHEASTRIDRLKGKELS